MTWEDLMYHFPLPILILVAVEANCLSDAISYFGFLMKLPRFCNVFNAE